MCIEMKHRGRAEECLRFDERITEAYGRVRAGKHVPLGH